MEHPLEKFSKQPCNYANSRSKNKKAIILSLKYNFHLVKHNQQLKMILDKEYCLLKNGSLLDYRNI